MVCSCNCYWWLALAGLVLLPFVRRMLKKTADVKGKLVFITGGSEGIGLCLGEEFSRRGANVVLMARTMSKLEVAVAQLKKVALNKDQKFAAYSIDVTNLESVKKGISAAHKEFGTPDYLVSSAGASFPGYFLEQDTSIFENNMNLNYMGTVNVVKTVAPLMVSNDGGRIMIVSSAAGICGFIGFSTYSPTKWALRGLADVLRNELSGFNIKVSICYPPDTDTPGFKREMEIKPEECKNCFPATPYSPEAVANQTIHSFLQGDYHIQSADVIQNLLVSSMSGVTPRAFFFLELILQPLIVLVQTPFYMWFDYQASLYAKKAKQN